MRPLMRERPFVDLLVQEAGFHTLATLLRSLADSFFQGEHCTYTNQILTEGASIAKKIVAESPRYHRQAMDYGIHEIMSILLHTEDPGVLPSAIMALLCLCDEKAHADQIADLNNFEVLLHIMQESLPGALDRPPLHPCEVAKPPGENSQRWRPCLHSLADHGR